MLDGPMGKQAGRGMGAAGGPRPPRAARTLLRKRRQHGVPVVPDAAPPRPPLRHPGATPPRRCPAPRAAAVWAPGWPPWEPHPVLTEGPERLQLTRPQDPAKPTRLSQVLDGRTRAPHVLGRTLRKLLQEPQELSRAPPRPSRVLQGGLGRQLPPQPLPPALWVLSRAPPLQPQGSSASRRAAPLRAHGPCRAAAAAAGWPCAAAAGWARRPSAPWPAACALDTAPEWRPGVIERRMMLDPLAAAAHAVAAAAAVAAPAAAVSASAAVVAAKMPTLVLLMVVASVYP